MNKRNIRHGFEGSGLTDDEIDSYDIAGPVGMASAITFLGGEWPYLSAYQQFGAEEKIREFEADVLARSAAHNAEQQALDSETFRARWGCD